jgi:hypothetical protein
MLVITLDQQGSRRVGDRVDHLLTELRRFRRRGLTRPFERTIGDEVQAVLEDPALAVDVGLHVLRLGGWSVGIGAGAVDVPLPASARAASGAAFVLARRAVERAKSRLRPVPLAVEASNAVRAGEAEAVLTLLGSIISRRTDAGWAVIDALGSPGAPATQHSVAAHLGITQQAVSQRLRTAMWAEELAVRPVAARLLVEGER